MGRLLGYRLVLPAAGLSAIGGHPRPHKGLQMRSVVMVVNRMPSLCGHTLTRLAHFGGCTAQMLWFMIHDLSEHFQNPHATTPVRKCKRPRAAQRHLMGKGGIWADGKGKSVASKAGCPRSNMQIGLH